MFKSVLCRILTFLVICVFALVLSKDCQRSEVKQGCTVDHGHAQCETWDLASGILGLPTCTTRIPFSLLPNPDDKRQYITINLGHANFTHLANLTELSVVANQSTYDRFDIWMYSYSGLFLCEPSLQNLHTLRIKVRHNEELSQFTNLRVCSVN